MTDQLLQQAKEELQRMDKQCAQAANFYTKGIISKDELVEQYNEYYRQKLRVNEIENPNPDFEYYKEQFRSL